MPDTGTEAFPQHSYIRRRGRLTRAQARALEQLTGNYLITPEQLPEQAGSHAVGIEIGFGMGHALLEWGAAAPDWRLFGIELYQPGIGALSDGLHRAQIDNVRILEQPAQQVLAILDDACVSEIRIFFPDPWPKKRHHKRRLIQADFVAEVARVLVPGGTLRLATDWTPYASWMRECVGQQPHLQVEIDRTRTAQAQSEETARQTTNFERRGERLGHDIHDLVYRRR